MSIIDRAARALLKAQSGTDDWDGLDAELQETLREEARAVLGAIREPTDAMVDAAKPEVLLDVDDGFREPEKRQVAVGCWEAMVDAALEEGQ